VVITTPGSKLEAEYVKSLMATIHTLQANNISWLYQNEYASLVTNAREATITGSRMRSPRTSSNLRSNVARAEMNFPLDAA
jgi:hypothetical protein